MSSNDERYLAGRQELLAFLDQNSIAYEETDHAAVTSMQESARLGLEIEGVRCKNLLMQDKKKQRLLLIVAKADRPINASLLGRRIGCGRLSLCSAEVLRDRLGVAQGALSPLALINDIDRAVELVIDDGLRKGPVMLFHPLVNTSTLALTYGDWLRFLNAIGYEPLYVTTGEV